MRRAFLTARWEHLVMLNYEVLAANLTPLVPRGTELDLWNGQALVSLVGFHFADTRVRGLPIPGHRNFEEVNLRFSVRRPMSSGPDRRAVVFVRELVPRFAIAAIARRLYNEPYLSVPMRHRTQVNVHGGEVEYAWRFGGREFSVGAMLEDQQGRSPLGPRRSSSPNTTGATRASVTAARSSTKSNIRSGASGPRREPRSRGRRRCYTERHSARPSRGRRVQRLLPTARGSLFIRGGGSCEPSSGMLITG